VAARVKTKKKTVRKKAGVRKKPAPKNSPAAPLKETEIDPTWIGQAEYARMRGVTLRAIAQAIEEGRLRKSVHDFGRFIRIDPEVADVEMGGPRGHSHKGKVYSAEKIDGAPTFAESKAVKERYNAELAKLAFEEKKGKLIDAEKVKKDAFEVARQVRDQILNIPDRMAAELAGISDPDVIYEKLQDELSKTLEGIANVTKPKEESTTQESNQQSTDVDGSGSSGN